jgi:aminopeptidase N
MRAVNSAFGYRMVRIFYRLDTYKRDAAPHEGIEKRLLKNTLLGLVAVEDAPRCHRIILDHLKWATTAEDRVCALTALNRSSAPQRREILERIYEEWHGHISGYANYLRIVSSGTCDDVFDMIAREETRPSFEISNPTLLRALFLPMASNTRMVWTDRGIRWVRDTVIKLAAINDYAASRLLNVFQHCRNLRPALREPVSSALERIADRVPEDVSPTVHRQALGYLGLGL